MNRLVLKVSAPGVLAGLTLSVACLSAAWVLNRLHRDTTDRFPAHMAALEAAQKLEIDVRDLRFLLLLQQLSPADDYSARVADVHADIDEALAQARASAMHPDQMRVIGRIDAEFRTYLREAEGNPQQFAGVADARQWAEQHPVAAADELCSELARLNSREMRAAVAAGERVSGWVQAALVVFCLVGPAAGFLGGFGVARGIDRSLARMIVLVRDVHASLDEEVGLLDVDPPGRLELLDDRLRRFADRVREVVAQVQRQQQAILRAEQLAAVGQLAAGVAHEVRNPLTGIKLLVESGLEGSNGRGDGLNDEDLRLIHREVVRLERTVQTLLDYARPQPPRLAHADIRLAVRQAVKMACPRAHLHGVDLRLVEPPGPVVCPHDLDQIDGVVTNLVINAMDAMPDGGTVLVHVRASDAHAVVDVTDDGPGIPSGVLGQLFTPFASSKSTGTGLGLSTSRRVAVQHGGSLAGENAPAGGARFTLTLPLHDSGEQHVRE